MARPGDDGMTNARAGLPPGAKRELNRTASLRALLFLTRSARWGRRQYQRHHLGEHMSILLTGPVASPPSDPLPVTRNRTGVATLVKKAPSGQHTLAWWLAWLQANWG